MMVANVFPSQSASAAGFIPAYIKTEKIQCGIPLMVNNNYYVYICVPSIIHILY